MIVCNDLEEYVACPEELNEMFLKGAFLIPHKAQHRPEQLARPCVPTKQSHYNLTETRTKDQRPKIGMVVMDLGNRTIEQLDRVVLRL